MLKRLTLSISILFIYGCNNEPPMKQDKTDVHKHIQLNQQEAKIAQDEYNSLKKQRINT